MFFSLYNYFEDLGIGKKIKIARSLQTDVFNYDTIRDYSEFWGPRVAARLLFPHTFLFWSSRYFWWGHSSCVHASMHTWPCMDYVRFLIPTAGICRRRVDRKLVCTTTCLQRVIFMQLQWWHQPTEVRLRGAKAVAWLEVGFGSACMGLEG